MPRPSGDAARRLRWAARAAFVAAVMSLAVLVWGAGLSADPGRDNLTPAVSGPLLLGLVAVAVVGSLVALRREAGGAATMAGAALALGLLAALQYSPSIGIAVGAGFAVPAVLTWLSWQRLRPRGAVYGLAVVTAALLAGEAVVAAYVYDRVFGAATNVSTTPRLDADAVEWVWSGALATDGARVVARLAEGASTARLIVERPGGPRHMTAPVRADRHRLVRMAVRGLQPGTGYRYVVEVDGRPDRTRGQGRFSTAPGGPASFTVAVASCARTGSNAAVFDAIRAARPMLYLITGDLHYANLTTDSADAFLAAYGRVLTAPAQAALYREVPVDYVWDDHDYGPNDADAASPGRSAARDAYRAAVPHPPLAAGESGPIHHAFTIGRVRFVVTDTRSERRPGSMLGEEQERWLLGELAAADRYGLVVWVNPDPWIAAARPGADDWGGYPEQRRRIADAVAAGPVRNLVMVSGDAHMLAIDDGSHSDFAARGGGGFPVLHAAALDRPGSVKGGPYSEGVHPGAGQFGLLRVSDHGGRITVDLEGRNRTGRIVVRHRFETGHGPAQPRLVR